MKPTLSNCRTLGRINKTMKIEDVVGHLRMQVNAEESAILEKFDSIESVNKGDLNEREVVIANKMVSRGLLERNSSHNGTFFFRNSYGE